MTLNGVMAVILRYFTEFEYDVVVKELLGLHQFQNLFSIVYDHINTICGWLDGRVYFNDGEFSSGLITRFDGSRC